MRYPSVFLILCVIAFLSLFAAGIITPVLPIYARGVLHAPDVMVGLIVSAILLPRIFIDAPGGAISDRIGRRIPLISGALISPLGGLICGISLNPSLVLLGRLIWGVGNGLIWCAAYSLIFDLFPPNSRGKSMGFFQSLEQIGQFIGASIGGIVADFWGMSFLFTVIVIVLSMAFVLCILPRELRTEPQKAEPETKTAKLDPPAIGLRELLTNWGFVIVCIGAFSRTFMLQGTIGTIFPLYLNGLGISQSLIGIAMGIRIAGMVFALFVSGFVVNWISEKILLVIGFILDTVVLFFYTFVSTIESFIPLAFIDGMGLGLILLSTAVLISKIVPQNVRGMGVGIYRTFFDAGAIGPIVLTTLLSIVNDIKACFYFTGIMFIGTFLLVLTVKRPKETL